MGLKAQIKKAGRRRRQANAGERYNRTLGICCCFPIEVHIAERHVYFDYRMLESED